MYEYYGSTQMN